MRLHFYKFAPINSIILLIPFPRQINYNKSQLMKILKKIIASALAVICFSLPIYAETTVINISTWKRKNSGTVGSIGRVPMNLPIEVTFDDTTGVVNVSAPEDLEGAVYVYSVTGSLEGYSPVLNSSFTLTAPGLHVISLQGENWIGEGKIIL